MAKKDPYEMFPEYKELREALMTTKKGRDLRAILYRRKLEDGYLLKSTGRFYIDVGSNAFLKKLPDGRWYYTSLSDGRPFSETWYSTMEEMLGDVWIKGILKRTPLDVKRNDLKKWLEDQNCPAKGKEFSIDDIIVMYMESIGRGYYIHNTNSLFTDPKWTEVFTFLGIKKRIVNDGNLRPTFSLGYLIPINHENPQYSFWENFLGDYLPKEDWYKKMAMLRNNLQISIKSSPSINKSISTGGLSIVVGANTKEEAEKKIIKLIIKGIKENYIITDEEYEKNPIAKLLVSMFSNPSDQDWINQIAAFVSMNPTIIDKIPSSHREKILCAAGISEELASTIQYAKDMGVMKDI